MTRTRVTEKTFLVLLVVLSPAAHWAWASETVAFASDTNPAYGADDRTHSSEGPVPCTWVLAKAGGTAILAHQRMKHLAGSVPTPDLKAADSLLAQGGLENIRNSLDLYRRAVALDPDNFEANWKFARALFRYSDAAEKEGLDNWQAFCRVYGKEGLQFGQKAIELEPARVEGHLYCGSCAWKYSQAIGLVQSWKEGLNQKARRAMEHAYGIDKTFDEGAPMKVLGLFWYGQPWPLRDYEAALVYFREYHDAFPEDEEGRTCLARTLLKLDRKAEAEGLLEQGTGDLWVLRQGSTPLP